MNVESQCPYCAEPLTLAVDESGGRRQAYVEDCVVCCRPIEVSAAIVGGHLELRVRRQDD
jgi:cysteine-rich CPXCG protein